MMAIKAGLFLALALALHSGAVQAADRVTIGVLNGASSFVPLIADDKGYFRAQDIDVEFVTFDSGAKMIPSLSTGQLAVGVGAASSALYNAAGRGLRLKIVADALRNSPGVGQSLLVRRDLLDDGSVHTIADLKGRKVGVTALASSEASSLDAAMRSVALTIDDVEPVYMGFPNQVTALQNRAIDAALTGEPFATLAINRGIARALVLVSDYYPDQETAVVIFGAAMLDRKDDLGMRFMVAYLKAARDYIGAQKAGFLNGNGADEIVATLARRSSINDAVLIKQMRAYGVDANGEVNVASLDKDLAFFKRKDQIEGDTSVSALVDSSFSRAAVQSLVAHGGGQ